MNQKIRKDALFTCIVIFKEHPVINHISEEPGIFDISAKGTDTPAHFIIDGIFSIQDYCSQLVRKFNTLRPVELMPFLEHQCRPLKDPIGWLNQLEKLLHVNTGFFIHSGQTNKMVHLLTLIEQKKSRLKALRFSHPLHLTEPFVTYNNNFQALLEELKKLDSYEDKITLLIKRKTEYLQNEPPFISKHIKPLDKLIDLEIDKLQQIQLLHSQKKDSGNQAGKEETDNKRIQFNAQLNILVDVFYQMKNKLSVNGKPYIGVSIQEITDMIVQNFLDKDGNKISPATVRTILSPNRPEKRPKQDKGISVKGTK